MAQSVDHYKELCPERRWYFELKHRIRSPLTLSRLPRHLWLRVIGKQAAITLPAFGQTCLEASLLVNSVVSGCEAAVLLRDTVQRYSWNGTLTSCAIDRKDDNFYKNIQTELGYYHDYELESILGWVRGFLDRRRNDLILADEQLVECFMKMKEELWDRPAPKTPAQRRQWNNVRLITLPDALGKSIIYKMTSQAVFRLRKTCRSSLQLVDSAIESNPLVSLAFELGESDPDDKLTVLRYDTLYPNLLVTYLRRKTHKLTVDQSAVLERVFDKLVLQYTRSRNKFPLKMDWDILGYGKPDFD